MTRSPVTFTKYHGTGNDFIVLDEADGGAFGAMEAARLASALCDRNRGVGADGLLLVQRDVGEADGRMIVINRDGSRPEMCGNGVRIVARHLAERDGLGPKVDIETDAGIRRCTVTRDRERFEVEVDMGSVRYERMLRRVDDDGEPYELHLVDAGNPHAVTFRWCDVPDVDRIGAALNRELAGGVNVEFVRQSAEGELDVVVYERGVGRTLACGTGACAVAVAAWEKGVADGPVVVRLPGGRLNIRREGDSVWMRGDARLVYRGELDTEWLAAASSP